MKRFWLLTLAALLLVTAACGASSEPGPVAVSETVPPAVQPSIETPEPVPTLSEGASEHIQRSLRFQEFDGELYTSLTRTEDVVCLYDLLPEDVGYIARFLITDGGIYAAVKSEYFTLDPASLRFFPWDGGDVLILADEISSDGVFLKADDALFFADADGRLCRCEIAGGETKVVLHQNVRLLDADGGFIFYAKDDGVYRNDSTLGAETLVIDFPSSCVRVEDGQIFDLMHTPTDAAIERRDLNGSLLYSVPLEEDADHFLLSGGRLYAPLLQAGAAAVMDPETGESLDSIPLDGLDGYCLLWYAAEDAVYYETISDGEIVLCRADKSGVQNLGPVFY